MKKIIIIFITLLLTGCYDYKETTNLAISSIMGISYEDENYITTIQLVHQKSEEETLKTYTASGKTLDESIHNINKSLSNKIYLAHLKLIILDEQILTSATDNIINFLTNDLNIRLTLPVATTINSTPQEIIEFLNKENEDNIYKLITTTNQSLSLSVNTDAVTLFTNYINDKTINLTNIELIDNNIEISNIISFKNKNYISLSSIESQIYNLITDNTNDSIMTFNNDKNNFTVSIINSNTKKTYNNNQLNLNTDITLSISNYDNQFNIDTENGINTIKKTITESLEKEINNLIDLSKDKNIDVLNLNNYFYKNKINNNYKDVNIKTNLSIEIIKAGNLKGGLE